MCSEKWFRFVPITRKIPKTVHWFGKRCACSFACLCVRTSASFVRACVHACVQRWLTHSLLWLGKIRNSTDFFARYRCACLCSFRLHCFENFSIFRLVSLSHCFSYGQSFVVNSLAYCSFSRLDSLRLHKIAASTQHKNLPINSKWNKKHIQPFRFMLHESNKGKRAVVVCVRGFFLLLRFYRWFRECYFTCLIKLHLGFGWWLWLLCTRQCYTGWHIPVSIRNR